ncbi:MAG: hypothetical protein ABEJ66_00285 [Candidatus Nanohaloarchaea archaeon]
MSQEDELLYDLQTLHSVNRRFEDQLYVVGTFGYRGEKLIVNWKPGGFTVYGSTDSEVEEIARTFEEYFPITELYVSEEGEELEQVFPNHYQDSWDVEAIRGLTEVFGFSALDREVDRFPDGEKQFWVFTDRENFDSTTEATRGVEDVFPELLDTGQEGNVLLEEATDFALMEENRLQ